MNEKPPSDPKVSDPDVTITLPLSAWEVVVAHLGRGAFCDVAKIVNSMCEQADLQVRPAQSAVPAAPGRCDPVTAARRKLQ